MTTILKVIVVAFAMLCAWAVLLFSWISYYNSQARKAGIIKPGDVVATDILGLQLSLFRSPWYCLGLAIIEAAAMILGWRWAFRR